MSQTYLQTKLLTHLVVRLSKEDSAFLYFTLEASDNLAFYSTRPAENGQQWRELDIRCPIEASAELQRTLQRLALKFPLEIISCEQERDHDN